MIELELRQRLVRRVASIDRRVRSRHALALSSVLLLALACFTRTSTSSAPADTLTVIVHIPTEADSRPIPGGVVIDVDASAGYRSSSVSTSTSNGRRRTDVTLNGKHFEVVGDVLYLGEDRFGPLRAGMMVRITSEGVLIDGQQAESMR